MRHTGEMDAEMWDERYGDDRIWSGRPNGALTVEVDGMTPGQALDVGCGEGADAFWLAERGWQVTAVDISRVALERAVEHAGDTQIAWQLSDLTSTSPPPRSFDLVSAHYFPLLRERDHRARGLVDSVAVGGTLLYVGHDLSHFDAHDHEHDWDGPDPRDYFTPTEIAELLDDSWQIQVNEKRARVDMPEGNPHSDDLVLRARRVR